MVGLSIDFYDFFVYLYDYRCFFMIKYNRLLEILKIPRNSSREEIIAKLIEVRNDNTNIVVDMGFEIKTSEGYPGLDYDLN